MFTRSVTGTFARTLFAIVLLSVLSSGLALLTLSTSLRDAEAVNIAGSLRMQSYRLALDATSRSSALPKDILAYQQSVEAPALRALDRAYVPESVRARYQALLLAWHALQPDLLAGNTHHYQQNVSSYVAQIDLFVLALQHWAELKMKLVAGVSLLGFIAIAVLVFWTLRQVKRQIVMPLNKLVGASNDIEHGHFHHAPLDTGLPNELGVLGRAFTRMSVELEKQYARLEQAVKEKTSDLRQANRRLALLYQCSETLNHHLEPLKAWPEVLEKVTQHENFAAIELIAPPHGKISCGEADAALPWLALPLEPGTEQPVAELRWQAAASEPQLMQGVATMLARSLQLDRAQQKVRHLLVMEERATIARELHDSLAQSLAYLRIQLARLKRVIEASATPAHGIVNEIDRALTEANVQLRELLTTFRLSIEPADLSTALQQVIATLQGQTEAAIELQSPAEMPRLEAQKQVHVLQIVREALLNAVRHAEASRITLRCRPLACGEILIEIEDNGTGIDKTASPPGHYGLSIMQERASSLQGRLTIAAGAETGTVVSLQFPV
ncbi:nitrate/nitrite two-component system sensor histidine kinase NarQ [Erwinia sp. MMLR14_017]|uniref:nitrate/nitrite two-component system sensor histidine kinase NarQ n=1 Tax=Erwinia sp. MMLR14_017 TaxID=3093842 RepID=UPI00298F7B94|nr:nitrate/nitrite two-component system sensor histidine kinase NarQ [Erwinia sp. MMLR14_017]MDW8847141.1 nitrate/nitrite two-component system sensor histidine kinase NarQ [Erwinia sp. MMLR14_017]